MTQLFRSEDLSGLTPGEILRARTGGGGAVPAAEGDWAILSEHYTEIAEAISIDDAVEVVVPQRAGTGTLSRLYSDQRRIVLDGARLPVAPNDLDASVTSHREALAELHGAFLHDLAHAMFSQWTASGLDPIDARIASALEDLRVEHRLVSVRPSARQWLRAAAPARVTEATNRPALASGSSPLDTLLVAMETVGRALVGVLAQKDVTAALALVEDVFPEGSLAELVDVVSTAKVAGDTDKKTMLELVARLRAMVVAAAGDDESLGGTGGEDGESSGGDSSDSSSSKDGDSSSESSSSSSPKSGGKSSSSSSASAPPKAPRKSDAALEALREQVENLKAANAEAAESGEEGALGSERVADALESLGDALEGASTDQDLRKSPVKPAMESLRDALQDAFEGSEESEGSEGSEGEAGESSPEGSSGSSSAGEASAEQDGESGTSGLESLRSKVSDLKEANAEAARSGEPGPLGSPEVSDALDELQDALDGASSDADLKESPVKPAMEKLQGALKESMSGQESGQGEQGQGEQGQGEQESMDSASSADAGEGVGSGEAGPPTPASGSGKGTEPTPGGSSGSGEGDSGGEPGSQEAPQGAGDGPGQNGTSGSESGDGTGEGGSSSESSSKDSAGTEAQVSAAESLADALDGAQRSASDSGSGSSGSGGAAGSPSDAGGSANDLGSEAQVSAAEDLESTLESLTGSKGEGEPSSEGSEGSESSEGSEGASSSAASASAGLDSSTSEMMSEESQPGSGSAGDAVASKISREVLLDGLTPQQVKDLAKSVGGAKASATRDIEAARKSATDFDASVEPLVDMLQDKIKRERVPRKAKTISKEVDFDEGDLSDVEDLEDLEGSHGFGYGGGLTHSSRKVRSDERILRRKLTQVLRKAQWRDRDITEVKSTLPPGRLSTREVLKGTAERSMGKVVTARPWRGKHHKTVETPHLRIAILCDVSGSMGGVVAAVASSMWITACATVDTGGSSVGIAFGDEADIIVDKSYKTPERVTTFPANGGMEAIYNALHLATERLDLYNRKTRGNSPRIVVVVSDGCWVDPAQSKAADRELKRLMREGVRVVHVGVGSLPQEHPGHVRTALMKPSEIDTVIGEACLAALKKA